SVMTPTSRPSGPQTPTQPKLLAVMISSASDIGASGSISGTVSPPCMMSRTRSSFRPSLPPGWNIRKSSVENPLRSNNAMASASPNDDSSVWASCSRPSMSARITRRATAMSRARPDSGRPPAMLVSPCFVETATALSPKTRPPAKFALMREDVLLRPALKIKQCACRQEIEAGTRQLAAPLARQHRVESPAQRVQVQHIGGGIAQLLVAQRCRAPIRTLLLLLQLDPEQVLAQIS